MAAQSVLDLSTPLNRLNALPTAVNWRNDTWSPTTLYYRNDIVISPITSGAYINISPATTIKGGGDPSTNPTAWFVFGGGAAGVQEIQGSDYITVGPTSVPEITNNGVCNLAIGQNLNNLGTQNDPILEDLGLTSILTTPGISVVGNTVSNTGVIGLNSGPEITITGASDLSLSYSGVVSITAPDGSITVGPGSSPLISNPGLLSLTTSTGLVNSSTPQTPNISNGGVIDISGGKSITVANFPFVKLSTVHPSVSLVGTLVNAVMTPPTTSSNQGSPPGRIPVTQLPGSLWATSIATQQPYSTGTYTIHVILGVTIEAYQNVGHNFGATNFTIYDGVNNVVYSTIGIIQPTYSRNFSNIAFVDSPTTTINSMIYRIVIDLATLWNSGFRVMTHIQLDQLGVGLTSNTLYLAAQNTNIFAEYSPNVVVRPFSPTPPP